MNIISVDSVSLSYEEKKLFTQISFGIAEGERIGLIGVNGSGKSTLLKTVAGLVTPDEGAVTFRSGLNVEYLAQIPEFDATATVLDSVYCSNSPAMQVLREYQQAVDGLAKSPEDTGLQTRLNDLHQQMDGQGLWAVEAQAKAILTRLGIAQFTRPVEELSGGQRKRVAMARALIQPADLLILDEPTNHIDNETVGWLEGYLSRFSGALLLVTHDRYFLDRVVTRMLELEGGRLHSYSGNYGAYLEQRVAREEGLATREEKRQNLLRRELAWLRRGAKARSTKQKARIQRVETLQAEQPETRDGAVQIAVGSHRLGRRIMEIKNLTKTFGTQAVIREFSYTLLPGDRIGIIGPNGSGKSTLLNLMAGRLTPDAGEIITGQTVRLAYYDQESGDMDPTLRVIDTIREVAEVVRTPDGGSITAAQMLERFLFPIRMQHTPVGKLSGGERRRLYLLRTLMSEPNVLLLDEPTNDLDIPTLTILEDYLDQFPGVVITVSHDRYFLDRVVDHLFAFEGEGRIRRYVGDYSDYLQERTEAALAGSAAKSAGLESGGGKTESAPNPGEMGGRIAKLTFREERELEGIEGEIAALEEKVASINAAIGVSGSDYERLGQLCQEQTVTESELSRKLDRWAELSERAEATERKKVERRP